MIMEKYNIRVTQKHIADGKPMHCHSCPVALAVSDSIPDSDCVDVDGCHISFVNTRSMPEIHNTPGEVSDFIRNHDTGVEVEPFEFVLDHSTRLGYWR